MVDVGTTILITVVAGFWGSAGAFAYWAIPKQPRGTSDFAKRIVVGYVAAALTNALGGISPFSASGAWDVVGLGKLVLAGFSGLATLATFFPDHLNENYRLARGRNPLKK